MGLGYQDLIGLSSIFFFLMLFKKALHIESVYPILAFVAFATGVLVPVRLKYRRKIIRDYLAFQVRKIWVRFARLKKSKALPFLC